MLKSYLQYVVQIILEAFKEFRQQNCYIMAAGMAFFGMLAFIPLLLIGFSMVGYLLNSSERAYQFMTDLLRQSFPESSTTIVEKISDILANPSRHFTGGLGLIGLIWSSLRFFSILESVLSSIWAGSTRRSFFRRKVITLGVFLLAGIFFWLSFLYNSAITAAKGLDITIRGISPSELGWLWYFIKLISLTATSTAIFFLVYKLLPNVHVSTKAALLASIFAGFCWEISKYSFSWFVQKSHLYTRFYGPLYGPLAVAILLMFWIYISMMILLSGAEIGSAYQEINKQYSEW